METETPVIQIERLEYGKICAAPDGAVMRVGINNMLVEHRTLGMSNGFPSKIIDICQPSHLNVKNRLGEELPAGCSYGTVLRSRVKNKVIQPIFFRLKQRAEDKDVPTSREYTIGRYLTSNRETSPRAFLTAMNKVPLYGLSEDDAAQYELPENDAALYGLTEEQCAKIDAVLVSLPDFLPSQMAQKFVREAISFVLSGIPLAFSSYVSENDFFECVTALWLALPSPLGQLLSAGWGVGSTFSGRLTVTYSQHQSATCALFSPDTLSWQPPAQIVVGNNTELITDEFFDARLIPGRAFVSLFYPSNLETLDYSDAKAKGDFLLEYKETSGSDKENKPSWFEEMPAVEFSLLPEAIDLPMLKVFRAPGFKVLDEIDYRRLSKWLSEGKDSDDSLFKVSDEIKLNAADFHYSHSRIIVLEEILETIDEPETRERGDIALWKSLQDGISDLFIRLIRDNPGKEAQFRAQLILALRQSNPVAMMNALMSASKAGQANLFPPEIRDALLHALTSSIEAADKETPILHACLRLHTQLLELPNKPLIYRSWLRQHGLNLVLTLAYEFGGISYNINQEIKEIVPDESVQTICSLLQYLAPDDADKRFIVNLNDAERQRFHKLLFQQWKRIDNETAARRESLIKWIRLTPPAESDITLLKIVWNQALEPRDADNLLNEIEESPLPAFLIKPLTIIVLRNWTVFSKRVDIQPEKWKQITDNFPATYRQVLFPKLPVSQNVAADAGIEAATNDLQLSSDDFSRLVRNHENSNFYRQVAPLLLELAFRSFKYSATPKDVKDLCLCLKERILPATAYPPALQEIDSCAELVRNADFEKLIEPEVARLWNAAEQSWHLVFLLAVFPETKFVVDTVHLKVLIPYRRWLAHHLSRVHHRQKEFIVAAQDFHSLNYQVNSNYWRDEFVRSGVWAAFEGVPPDILPDGALRKALSSYSCVDGVQSTNEIELQADFGWRFLQSYKRNYDEYRAARRKVEYECLFPLLDRILKNETKDILTAADKDANGGWRDWMPSILSGNGYQEYIADKVRYSNLIRLLKDLTSNRQSGSLLQEYKKYRHGFRK